MDSFKIILFFFKISSDFKNSKTKMCFRSFWVTFDFLNPHPTRLGSQHIWLDTFLDPPYLTLLYHYSYCFMAFSLFNFDILINLSHLLSKSNVTVEWIHSIRCNGGKHSCLCTFELIKLTSEINLSFRQSISRWNPLGPPRWLTLRVNRVHCNPITRSDYQ